MKISRLISVILLHLFVATAAAEVEWLSKEYNFGVIREADGKVTGCVKLINRGPDATFISRVRPSCGCTGVSYTQNVIEAGDSATISFTYNPQGRPGPFNKTMRVYMGSANELTTIRITGTVIGSSATLDSHFPYTCGSLRLERTEFESGELKKGQSRHFFINVYNQGEKKIKPEFKSSDKALSVSLKPAELQPGGTGTFTLCLKTAEATGVGPFEYSVDVWPAGKKEGKISIDLRGVIVPDISKIPLEELENAPQAFLVPEFVDLGENLTAQEAEFEFSVVNEGKSPLKVERVYSRHPGVEIISEAKEIGSGEKRIVKGKLDLRRVEEGAFRIKVEVLTNDAVHPIRVCSIVGIKK